MKAEFSGRNDKEGSTMSNDDTGAIATTSEEVAPPGAKCPVMDHPQAATGSTANQHWWPDQLNLRPLARTRR